MRNPESNDNPDLQFNKKDFFANLSYSPKKLLNITTHNLGINLPKPNIKQPERLKVLAYDILNVDRLREFDFDETIIQEEDIPLPCYWPHTSDEIKLNEEENSPYTIWKLNYSMNQLDVTLCLIYSLASTQVALEDIQDVLKARYEGLANVYEFLKFNYKNKSFPLKIDLLLHPALKLFFYKLQNEESNPTEFGLILSEYASNNILHMTKMEMILGGEETVLKLKEPFTKYTEE